MSIDFVWIKTDVSTYSIHFNRSYNYTYNLINNTLERKRNNEYISNLYGKNIENIVAVIGENGAGKSTFLKVLMEVLDGNKFTNYKYIIVGKDLTDGYFSTNINNLRVEEVENQLPIDRIRDFEVFFYSNIFDANNLIKYPSKIRNISTNAMMDSFDTQLSGITNYRSKNVQSQILFTIINQKNLHLSDFVKIPEFVYLKLNETVTESIYNKKPKEDRNYGEVLDYAIMDYIGELFDEKDIDELETLEEKKELLRKVYNLTYNKIIQWLDNLFNAIEHESFLSGDIHWDKSQFNLFWNRLQSDLEVERNINSLRLYGNIDSITAAQFELLKENISSISQNEINNKSESIDKIINKILGNVEVNIMNSYLNILDSEMELIKSQLKKFLSEKLEIDFLLTENEIVELKNILENVVFDVSLIQEELHKWLEDFLEDDVFEDFLEKLEDELIFLIKVNSTLKEVEMLPKDEQEYYKGFNVYSSMSEFDLKYDDIDSEKVARTIINDLNDDFFLQDDFDFNNELELLNDIEKDFSFISDKNFDYSVLLDIDSIDDIKIEFINRIIKMFNNFYTPMIKRLNMIVKLTENIEIKSRQFRIKTTNKVLKNYIERYKEDNFFNLEWRNLSSGEYSILNLFTRFYELRLSINSDSDILVVIDEGELYFHPQWQKRYIDILSNMFNQLLPNNRVQVLITSHSPFVVSDLPHYNLILLKKDNTDSLNSLQGLELERTFGGNIQDLFSNAFFIRGGLTGEYSKKVINNAIGEILRNQEIAYKNQDYYKKLFNLIGEPLVKNKCMEILNVAVEGFQKHISKSREEEIKELKNRLRYLENLQ